jgi:hypothetical protein
MAKFRAPSKSVGEGTYRTPLPSSAVVASVLKFLLPPEMVSFTKQQQKKRKRKAKFHSI